MKQHEFFIRRVSLMALATILLAGLMAGCIFGNDTKTDDGWKKVSMPEDLKGTWYLDSIEQFSIDATHVTMNNRTWGVNRIEHKDTEHRIIMENDREYVALYFRSITTQTVFASIGGSGLSLYDATQADRTDWFALNKGE